MGNPFNYSTARHTHSKLMSSPFLLDFAHMYLNALTSDPLVLIPTLSPSKQSCCSGNIACLRVGSGCSGSGLLFNQCASCFGVLPCSSLVAAAVKCKTNGRLSKIIYFIFSYFLKNVNAQM